MKQSESINTLLKSLTMAQSEYPTLPKDKKGYGYNYTDLDTVITTIKPIFEKNKLGFIQSLTTLENGKNGITTRIFSVEGEWIEDTIALPDVAMAKTNAAQNLGASITYMRRYALCSMLGISSDEDVDATTTTETQSKQTQSQTPQKKNTPSKLKGGPDTPAQTKIINDLLKTEINGFKVFSSEEIKQVASWRLEYTADEVIATLSEEAAKRTAIQPEVPDAVF
jgi:hypothetical protein